MKLNKKKVFAIALAVCLIAILSFSTLAWFSDSESVKNDFIVSSKDETPDKIFSVDVYEEIDTDGDGEPDTKVDEDGTTFENVVPGDVLYKAPYVQNTGRYDQWIRLTITFNTFENWQKIGNGTEDAPLALLSFYDDFGNYWVGDSWEILDSGEIVYTYYLKNVLKPGEVVGTFTHVNIPGTLTQNDIAGIDSEELTLTVVAEAVQVELGESAKEAFEKIEASGQEIDQIK